MLCSHVAGLSNVAGAEYLYIAFYFSLRHFSFATLSTIIQEAGNAPDAGPCAKFKVPEGSTGSFSSPALIIVLLLWKNLP